MSRTNKLKTKNAGGSNLGRVKSRFSCLDYVEELQDNDLPEFIRTRDKF